MNFIKDGDGHYRVEYDNGVYMGDILQKEDGFYDFWPELRGGYWESSIMREIADKLDALNAPWEKEIDNYFNTC